MSNKTKSHLFFWSVVMCIVLAGCLAASLRMRLSGSKTPLAAASSRPLAVPLSGVKLDSKANKLYTDSGQLRFNYTINPQLQLLAEQLLEKYDPFEGAIVGLDPKTGAVRVVAVYTRKRAEYLKDHPYESLLDPVARSSTYPMGSVAKIITSAAAFRAKLFEPDSTFDCNGRAVTNGGTVFDAVGEVHGSITMGDALAKSCNSTFAKIALKVGRNRLLDEFTRFGFNTPIDFDLPLLESTVSFGDSDYALARTGSGWEGTRISPIHAAMIAATISSGGDMPRAYMVESASRGGKVFYRARPSVVARPISGDMAQKIGSMFYGTVNEKGGTAYKGFYKGGKYQAGDIRVVGKTGSLNGNSENESYTWFVGYVERGDPGIAFATMILNDGNWTIKAASFTGQFFKTIAYENR